MSELFELNPELLLQQSQEMLSLRASYESLFDNMTSVLRGINGSWSELLSNNFLGKITSAQKSFMGALNMFQNSANKVNLVANTAIELDSSWAAKLNAGAKFGPVFNSRILSDVLGEYISDAYGEGQEVALLVKSIRDRIGDKLTSSQDAWLKLLEGKVGKQILGKANDPTKVAMKILEGDYLGAIEDLGEKGFEIIAEAIVKGEGLEISKSDLGQYVKYAVNLTKDGAEAITEFCMDPNWENLGEIAWNATVQPILDTAGDKIEKVVRLIPGVSEYYAEKGAENIGDMCSVALGEFYGLISGDEEMRQYASTYYENQGGLWEGIYNGFEEAASFVKDSGGIGNAVKNFFETASKDADYAINYNIENAKIILENGGLISSMKKGLGSMVNDAVIDTVNNVWHLFGGKE